MAEPDRSTAARALRVAHLAVLVLVGVEALWEWRLAPLRPNGSWLVLKAVPLAAVLPFLLRGGTGARFATALLLLAYFAEGIVRALTEQGRGAIVAAVAAALALLAFAALFIAARAARARER